MDIQAENDYLFLKRQEKKNEGFIDAGANTSPFFVVLSHEDTSPYEKGDLVIPKPDALIFVKIDGEDRFFISEHDVLGVVDESN